jgi:hypothetical protein
MFSLGTEVERSLMGKQRENKKQARTSIPIGPKSFCSFEKFTSGLVRFYFLFFNGIWI